MVSWECRPSSAEGYLALRTVLLLKRELPKSRSPKTHRITCTATKLYVHMCKKIQTRIKRAKSKSNEYFDFTLTRSASQREPSNTESVPSHTLR